MSPSQLATEERGSPALGAGPDGHLHERGLAGPGCDHNAPLESAAVLVAEHPGRRVARRDRALDVQIQVVKLVFVETLEVIERFVRLPADDHTVVSRKTHGLV